MDTLNAPAQLDAGGRLTSANGRYTLVLQTDGNLVLYEGATAVWSTDTWKLPAFSRPTRAVMQTDGNFVLYSDLGQAVWATGTHGKGGNRLTLQDDRNLVVYRPDGKPVWDTGTWVRNAPHPTDGGPVVRQQRNEVGWGKVLDTTATLYRDGSLVVTTKTENHNWTGGLRGNLLVVAVDDRGRAVWVSQVLTCTTRCSIPDFSCASFGTNVFREKFPDVVGPMAARLDVFHADHGDFVNLRKAFVEAITTATDIAKVVGPFLALL